MSSSQLIDTTTDKDFKEKLEDFKNANYCCIEEFNTLQSDNAIEYVELNNEDSVDNEINNEDQVLPPPPIPPNEDIEEFNKNRAGSRKQPPPVMKKPEKSEEIIRKLGCRSGLESVSQQFGTVSSISSTSSSINNDRVSNSSASNTEASVCIRLSTSKATDV